MIENSQTESPFRTKRRAGRPRRCGVALVAGLVASGTLIGAHGVNNVVTAQGAENRAFVGNNTAVSFDAVSLDGDFTISAWVKLNPGISNEDAVVGSDTQNLNFHKGYFRLFAGIGAGRDIVIATTPTIDGEWTHVAAVRDGGITSIYMNGRLGLAGLSPIRADDAHQAGQSGHETRTERAFLDSAGRIGRI